MEAALKVRRPAFAFSSRTRRYWHAGDAWKTHFNNSYSVLLPVAERFFIGVIAQASRGLADEALRKDARAFCGQEGSHAAAHARYNRWLVELGYGFVPAAEKAQEQVFTFLQGILPDRLLLAMTVAAEMVTTLLSREFLRGPGAWSDRSDPEVTALWRWHAAEELEHRSVCFRVYQAVDGRLWLRRLALIPALALLLPFNVALRLRFLLADGMPAPLFSWRGAHLPELIRECARYWSRDFDPDTTPGARDDGELLGRALAQFA
jgi:uncharacterized protein